jgi:elongation factor G
MAAHQALKNALADASPKLLEPIMFLEITVPDQFVGDVAGLLGARGAKIENMFDRSGQKIVQALAPLRRLFGFSTHLRSATQGRAGMVMKFSKFDVLE